jgi:hypothetical protein
MDEVGGPGKHVRHKPGRSADEDGVEHGRPVAADEESEDEPNEQAEGGAAPYR